MEFETAAAYMLSALTFEEKHLAKELQYYKKFNPNTQSAYVRAPVLELRSTIDELIKMAAAHDRVPRRINLYCDTIKIPSGTSIDIPNKDGVMLSIYCRSLLWEASSTGAAFSMAMVQKSQLGIYSNNLPSDFKVGFKAGAQTVTQTLEISPDNFGVSIRHNGTGLEVTQRGAPDVEMQHADYLHLINEDGSLSDLEFYNDNLPRLLQFQFLVAISQVRLNIPLCLDLLNYICAGTATPHSSAFHYQVQALRSNIVSQVQQNVCSVPSVNVYASKQVLKARLLAAQSFEQSFNQYIAQDRSSENWLVATANLLAKSNDSFDDYRFLEGLASKAYDAAQAANEQARQRFIENQNELERCAKAFQDGVNDWKDEQTKAAVKETITAVIGIAVAVGTAVATCGATAPAAIGAVASTVQSAGKFAALFAKIKETIEKIKDVYVKLKPVLEKLKGLGENIQSIIGILATADGLSAAPKALKAGDMSNDAFNATAQWDIFDINVNIMHENLTTFAIGGKDEYYHALKTVVVNGKAFLQTQSNLLQKGNELATVLLRKKAQAHDQSRLERALKFAQTDNGILALLQRAMFDRLLAIRSLVFLDFWNYTSAYMYHSLASDLPISLSAVKPVGDYLADAARLQAAVNSFGSSVLIQKKKFTIRTLGSAESAAQLQQLLQSSKGVDFQVSTEHPEFDKFCRVRLSKVRCYIEGIKSKGENETRPLGLLLQSDGQFQDIDFPQVPRRVSLSRSFVGDSHKIFFESALDGSAIQCDGDYGQKRDYTMQTPFTKWNASIVEDELALDDLDFSQAEGLKVEFWCEVCLRQ